MVNCIGVVVVDTADSFEYLVVNWVHDYNNSVVADMVGGVLVDGVLVDVVAVATDVAITVAVAVAVALVVVVAVLEFQKVNGACVNFVPVVD